VKRIPFISLGKLIEIVCEEQNYTTINHDIYFIEHLPNGKYITRKVTLQQPFSPEK